MAVRFQALTGIEPLSVDQTLMTEHSQPEKEAADYRLAVEKGLVKDKPVVLREKEGKGYYVPAAVREAHDVVIFHPRTRYENGRPTWMALGGRRTAHAVKTEARPLKGGDLPGPGLPRQGGGARGRAGGPDGIRRRRAGADAVAAGRRGPRPRRGR